MKDCRNVGVLSTSEVTKLLKEASSMAPSITLRKGAIFRSLFCHEVAASAPLLMTKAAAAATALGGVERAEFIVLKAVLRWRS